MNVTDQTSHMIKGFLLFFLVLTGMIPVDKSGQQSDESEMKAWIESSHEDDSYTFSGRFLNETGTEISCTYQLKVGRSGRSGISSSSQRGQFTAAPGKEVNLSTISVNIQDNDFCRVGLSVWLDEQLIAGDTLVMGDSEL